ncbi:TIGR01244 family phosphatase [Marinomonas agarivorans]|nr:TIGR01244 family phosphatase [Marinomonas agarivorans]
MIPIELDSKYFVLPQITIEGLEELKQQGFDLIINNRPDNEEENQPLSIEIAAAAKSLGLNYVHNPVELSKLSEIEIKQQKAAVNQGQKTLAFCRTGTRSSVLWALNNQSNKGIEPLLKELKSKGFDMERCMPAMTPFIK